MPYTVYHLLREIHAAQEVLEARVGAQGVEIWQPLDPDTREGVLPISLFKPVKGFFLLARARDRLGQTVFVTVRRRPACGRVTY
jgi:hypothetical protein